MSQPISEQHLVLFISKSMLNILHIFIHAIKTNIYTNFTYCKLIFNVIISKAEKNFQLEFLAVML
jgi:hypothetical protein